MFPYGLIWKALKTLLVREGRSTRQEFLAKGAAPLFLSLFAMLLVPASPGMGDFGVLLLVSSVFLSRAALAQAIRRAHDIGTSDTQLKSVPRQIQAAFQAFGALLVITTYQQINRGAPMALLVAAAGAAIMTIMLLGGPTLFRALVMKPGNLALSPNALGGAETMAAFGLYSVDTRVDPRAASARQRSAQPGQEYLPQPDPARARPALKVPRNEKAPPQPLPQPQPHQPPVVRKRARGAVGEWG